jgi:hypothetical protein
MRAIIARTHLRGWARIPGGWSAIQKLARIPKPSLSGRRGIGNFTRTGLVGLSASHSRTASTKDTDPFHPRSVSFDPIIGRLARFKTSDTDASPAFAGVQF